MKSSGLFRLGRDAEARALPSGEIVVNLALAFNYGKKGQDGSRPSQWIDASMWGERASKIAPYLLKGNQVVVHLSDLHIETYQGQNGPGSKLVGRVDDVELVSSQQAPQQPQRQAPQPQRQPAPQRQAPQQAYQAPAPSGFDDADMDIPF